MAAKVKKQDTGQEKGQEKAKAKGRRDWHMRVLKCDCSNSFQDGQLGKGKRWHNPCKPSKQENYYRCIVCSREKVA